MKKGYTLAELLIVIGIFGLVMEMTIPSMILSVQNQQYRFAFKKAYSELSTAYRSAAFDNGGTLVGLLTGSDSSAVIAIEPYIKYRNFCHYKTAAWHLDNQWYYSDKTPVTSPHPASPKFGYSAPSGLTLNDNVLVAAYSNNTSGTAQIFVDTNGFKKPNTIGQDIFLFYLKNTGQLIPYPGAGTGSTCSGYGWDCTAYALLNY